MNFRKTQLTTSARELARGYMDDWLIISFGIWNRHSYFLEVRVEDVLRDHQICDELIQSPQNDSQV
jgi:hypothetical protein